MTAAVAAHLQRRGLHVAILSRGYGSKGEGVRVVGRGDGPLLGPRVAGDEPVLLAGLLRGVSVVVCPDRYRAGLHAMERLDPAPDLFLLDDGFSHLKLHRDLDILLFPASDPFAGGRLLPSGRLREPLASSSRADVALLTGCSGPSRLGDLLARALSPHGFEGRGFISQTVTAPARSFKPGSDGVEIDPGSSVFVVSAVARPENFLQTVHSQGFDVVDHHAFPDHHDYPDKSLEFLKMRFSKSGARWLVTTGKDRVKLQGRLDLPTAEIPLHAEPDPEFFQWLDHRVGLLTAGDNP